MHAEEVSFLLSRKKIKDQASDLLVKVFELQKELNAQIGQISYVKVRTLFENRNQKYETLTLEDI